MWSFGNFSRPDRDPRQRVISVAYLALLPFETLNVAAGSDAVGARWFGVDALPRLAFDHDEIVEQGLKSLRNRNDLSVLFALLPERFTLSALQSTYEAIMGKADKRNFRKMALESKLLKETNAFERGSHRPARLYEAQRSKKSPDVHAPQSNRQTKERKRKIVGKVQRRERSGLPR